MLCVVEVPALMFISRPIKAWMVFFLTSAVYNGIAHLESWPCLSPLQTYHLQTSDCVTLQLKSFSLVFNVMLNA
jgi:hypothetical protein